MKYVLVGTHSTGKSTLLEELKRIHPEFNFVNSVTRHTTSSAERKLMQVSDEVQHRIFKSILKQEKELYSLEKLSTIIMDRSFVDFTAYTTIFWQDDLVSEEFKNKIEEECKQRLKSGMYSKIFYLPIEFELVDDGVRNTNDTLRWRVDAEIRKLIKDFSPIEITGTVEQRIKQIESYIK